MSDTHPDYKSMFLAIELDAPTKKALGKLYYIRNSRSSIRWQPQRDFHMTLGFIANVKWEERTKIIKIFKPLENESTFTVFSTGARNLGRYGQILCVQFGPQEQLERLSNGANHLLQEETTYQFDSSYSEFIPHTKIQSLKGKMTHEQKSDLIARFKEKATQKLEFTVKTLALMERKGRHYQTLARYPLKT